MRALLVLIGFASTAFLQVTSFPGHRSVTSDAAEERGQQEELDETDIVPLSLSLSDAAEENASLCYTLGPEPAVHCPDICPVKSSCLSDTSVSCIQADACNKLLSKGQAMMSGSTVCKKCALGGCKKCLDPERCEICREPGFELKDGLCVWKMWPTYLTILIIIGLVGAWISFDFARASCYTTTNREAVTAGIQAWRRSSIHRFDEDGTCRRYTFCEAPLHSVTKAVGSVGGPGLVLFMNWFGLCIALGIWLVIGAALFGTSKEDERSLLHPCIRQYPRWESNATVPLQLKLKPIEGTQWTEWAAFNYFGAVALSLVFFVVQERNWNVLRRERNHTGLCNFCVQLSGFPKEATNKKEILEFLKDELKARHLPEDSIRSISIAYAYEKNDMNQKLINYGIDKRFQKARLQFNQAKGSTTTEVEEPYPGPFWVRVFAWAMCGADLQWCRRWCPSDQEDVTDDDVADFLRSLPSSGSVFVSMHTEPLAVALASCGTLKLPWTGTGWRTSREVSLANLADEERSNASDAEAPRSLFSRRIDAEGVSIKTHQVKVDPPLIRWDDFFPDTSCFWLQRVVTCCFGMALLLVVWIVIYANLVEFSMNTVEVEGTTALLASNILGMTVGLGNAALAYGVQFATNYAGFKIADNKRLCELLLSVPLVALNCFADLYMTRKVASTRLAGEDWVHSPSATLQDVAHLFSPIPLKANEPLHFMQEYQEQLFFLLVPGYVLLPYVLEPLLTVVLPLFVGIWRVKCDRISSEEAQRIMLPAEVEIVNPPYCDMITTTSTIMFTFWLMPSSQHFWFFLCYIGWAMFLYLQMRTRILWFHQYTCFGLRLLHQAESLLWSIPLGILAASLWKEIYFVEFGVNGFLMHVGFHISFVMLVLPRMKKERISSPSNFEEARKELKGHAKLYTYRNCNPVEVLKSPEEDTFYFDGLDVANVNESVFKYELRQAIGNVCDKDKFNASGLDFRLYDSDWSSSEAKCLAAEIIYTENLDEKHRFDARLELRYHAKDVSLRGIQANFEHRLIFYRPSEAYLQPEAQVYQMIGEEETVQCLECLARCYVGPVGDDELDDEDDDDDDED